MSSWCCLTSRPASLSSTPTRQGFQMCGAGMRRVTDFLKELPVAVSRAEPVLEVLQFHSKPLEQQLLSLRQLQTNLVYATVLAKKCRVSPKPTPVQASTC